MKKLLFQFDTDSHYSVFDTVVAYDGGADHVIGHANLTPETVGKLVEGAIFTRAPKDKKNTAIFIGGSDLSAGQNLLKAVQRTFFADFRVSVMLDSNGSNTTAAAGVAKLVGSYNKSPLTPLLKRGEQVISGPASTKMREQVISDSTLMKMREHIISDSALGECGLRGKKAVVLAGTGPVGQRAAVMLAKEGADVSISSRSIEKATAACEAMKKRFGVSLTPIAAFDNSARAEAIRDSRIVFATGAAGVNLLDPEHWQDNASLELIMDANATPPLGIGGTDMLDRGAQKHGKIVWGAIGFGTLKLALHRACIARLFEQNDLVLDAEEIFAIAKSMT